jgi:DivIVA domain-containing protein
MEPQNPEDRIAELERQLAERKHMAELKRQQAGPVNSPVVTPDDIRNVAFSKPPIGRRGYNEDEVDAFLDRVAAALQDPTASSGVTPADIHDVAFSKPPIGKRGYNEDEVDTFLDRVAAALVGPRESDTFGMRVNEESAVSGEPIRDELHMTSPKPGRWKASDGKWYAPQPENRCLLMAIPSWWKQHPSLAVEVGKDALRVFDPNSNALIASASPSQVTATPAKFRESASASDWGGMRVRTRPVLVVDVPGLQPLIIGCPWHGLKLRFAWRGQVGEAKRPRYVVTDADWPILVEKLGLAPYLEDRTGYSAEGSW